MNFEDAFKHLTGNLPFPWQAALYQRFISNRQDNIPSSCNLPTGLGKTSVVALWLIALARIAHFVVCRFILAIPCPATRLSVSLIEIEKAAFNTMHRHGLGFQRSDHSSNSNYQDYRNELAEVQHDAFPDQHLVVES